MTSLKLENEPRFAVAADAREADADQASVLLAVASVLSAAGRTADYIDLAGASGLGMLFTFVADADRPGDAVIFGRDLPLADSADAFGLITRPMHPPQLDGGVSCGSFAEHFRDSYAPLMAAAVEHGQPLLCWGGWPGRACDAWGVLTRCDAAHKAFGGWTIGALDGPVVLEAAPRQVHVVEQVLDAPTPATMLATGLRLAAGWSDHPVLLASGVLTGSAAMDAWADRLASDSPFCECDQPWTCCHRLARSMYGGRVAAYEFIYRHAEAADGAAAREACQRLELELGEQVEQLADLADANKCRQTFNAKGGRAKLADTVRRLADVERDVEAALAPMKLSH